jgi:hypothetical protein
VAADQGEVASHVVASARGQILAASVTVRAASDLDAILIRRSECEWRHAIGVASRRPSSRSRTLRFIPNGGPMLLRCLRGVFSAVAALSLGVFATPALAQDFYDETIVRTIQLNFTQPNWQTLLTQNKAAGLEAVIPADLIVDGVTYPGVGVRYKGNSSYWLAPANAKKPFNIDVDFTVSGQDVMGHDKIILNNCWGDPSFLREVVAYRIFRKYVPASRANYVKLLINGVNYGIYVNVEQVGGEFIDKFFRDGDGNRYKTKDQGSWPDTIGSPPPTNDMALRYLGTNPTTYQAAYEWKGGNTPAPWNDLIQLTNVLNNTPSATLKAALEDELDVQCALYMVALNSVLANLDSYTGYGQNYYVYNDPYHGLCSTIPWDLNMSFGAFVWQFSGSPGASNYVGKMTATYQDTNVNRPLLSKLVVPTQYREDFYAHVRAILNEEFSWTKLQPQFVALRALIDSEIQVDTKLVYTYSSFLNNLTATANTYTGLQPLIAARETTLWNDANINKVAPVVTGLAHAPVAPTLNDAVTFTATVTSAQAPLASVTLRYRTVGKYLAAPMFDDGAHGDGFAGDAVFGVVLPAFPAAATVQYYVEAQCAAPNGSKTFAPTDFVVDAPSFKVPNAAVPSDLRINEFMASNTNGALDETGTLEDWVEIYNAGGSTLDLSGLFLTDDVDGASPWAFPAGTLLPAGQTLLVWADEDPLDGPLHASFKLSKGGEEVALLGSNGTDILDHVVFGAQKDNVSTGRLFDGQAQLVTFIASTPGTLNAGGCGARRYDQPVANAHSIALTATGAVQVGGAMTVSITNAPASAPAPNHENVNGTMENADGSA